MITKMKFRANTSLLHPFWVSVLIVWSYCIIHYGTPFGHWLTRTLIALVLSIVLFIGDHLLTYWEMNDQGLRWRRLWKVGYIDWHEITLIGRLGFSDKYVKITYGRSAASRAYILADPTDLNGFIAALRRHVPDANWDILPNSTPTCTR